MEENENKMDEKTKNKKAIIIGCGIAGPSLAIALKHAGIDSEIYEAVNTPPSFGILSMSSNAIHVLEMLGVYDQVKADDTEGVFFYKHSGKLLHTIDVRDELKKYGNEGGFLTRRADVIKALSEKAIAEDSSIQYGKKLVDIKEKEERVVAVFEDGTHVEGDFLIGCDGPFSKTRNIILPDSPFPTYTGTIWVGANSNDDSITQNLKPNAFHTTIGKEAFFGSVIYPDKKTTWWTNVPYPEKSLKDKFKKIPSKEWTEKLLTLHKDDHKLIHNLIKSANDEYVKIPLYDIPHLPIWHKNSVCLIGDAAHATSPYIGQGAAMAMEDAVVLAKCLRDIPNLSKAFSTFENLRKDRVEKTIKNAQQAGNLMTTRNPVKKLFRNLFLPFIFNKSIVKRMDWLFSYKIDWDKKIK